MYNKDESSLNLMICDSLKSKQTKPYQISKLYKKWVTNYVSDSPPKLGLLNAGCKSKKKTKTLSSWTSTVVDLWVKAITHHINTTGCFGWQAQLAQFNSSHTEHVEEQPENQSRNDDGGDYGSGYNSSICAQQSVSVKQFFKLPSIQVCHISFKSTSTVWVFYNLAPEKSLKQKSTC